MAAMAEEKLILELEQKDEVFRQIMSEHRQLDVRVQELSRKHYLNPQEEMERTVLKKRRLAGKDKIAQLLEQYRRDMGLID